MCAFHRVEVSLSVEAPVLCRDTGCGHVRDAAAGCRYRNPSGIGCRYGGLKLGFNSESVIGCHCALCAVWQVMAIRTPPAAEVAARPAAAAITSGRRLDVRAAVIAAVI